MYVGSVYIGLGSKGRRYNVKYYKVHPNWTKYDRGYDISVIKVTERLKFNKNAQPINLPIGISVVPGDEATVAGWGVHTV